jgi:trypsin-like peptidase
MVEGGDYDRMTNYVVRVYGDRRDGQAFSGTGFIVSVEGHVLTCWHVVVGATHINIKIPYEEPRPYRVLGSSEPDDLVLLQGEVPPSIPTPAAALGAAPSPADLGRDVTVLGYSSSAYYAAPQIYACKLSAFSEREGRLGINATINEGDSGAPVMAADGRVIGVVQAKDPKRAGHAMAVPVTRALELLQRHIPTSRHRAMDVDDHYGRFDLAVLRRIGAELEDMHHELTSGIEQYPPGTEPAGRLIEIRGLERRLSRVRDEIARRESQRGAQAGGQP